MDERRKKALPWVLLFLLLGICVVDAIIGSGSDPEIERLEAVERALRDTVDARGDSIVTAFDRLRDAEAALLAVQISNDQAVESTDVAEEPRVREFEELIAGDPILVAGFDSVKASFERRIAVRDSALASERRKVTRVRAEMQSTIDLLERQKEDALEGWETARAKADEWERKANPPFVVKLLGDLPDALKIGGCALIGAKVGESILNDQALGAGGAATLCRLAF